MEAFPKIPGFSIEKKIGEGATASVYLCIQEKLGCKRAVKVLKPELLNVPLYARRFLKEARIAAKLNHPGIVQIYDVKQTSSLSYIVMEYLGKSLKDKIAAGNHLPGTEISRIIKQVAGALDYAHSKEVAHRDIKPANILFKEDGTPVLVDFGLALDNDPNETRTMSNNPGGTGNYMSPEQCRGEKGDYAGDFYSLGVVLFEMLTGEVPYKSENFLAVIEMHKSSPIPRLPARVSRYQPLIDRMMAKNKAERFKDGQQIICMIDELTVPGNKEINNKEVLKVPVLETKKTPVSLPSSNRKPLNRKAGKKKKEISILKSLLFISIGCFVVVVAFLAFYLYPYKLTTVGGVIGYKFIGSPNNLPVRVALSFEPLKLSTGDVIESAIYYSLDGSEPTRENGVKYKGGNPIEIKKEGTYTLSAKVIAREGNYDGPGFSRVFTISGPPVIRGGVIQFEPGGGEFGVSITVRLNIAGPLKSYLGDVIDADIFYTRDGSEPTKEKGMKYKNGEPIVIKEAGTHTLRARAIAKVGKYEGLPYSQTYTIEKDF